jgi:DNA-binding response OmpR family regulator
LNIIIVNTDSEAIENINCILTQEQLDWKLSIINSGKECLDVVKNGSCPDVVILGMQLSDMLGFDLLERVRDYSDIPIIVLSHHKDIFNLVKAFDLGANDYVEMPFNRILFLARLKALIRRVNWNIQAGKE